MNTEQEPSTNLTIDECEELAAALFEDAAALPPGPKKQEILKLAQGYRSLGKMKRLVLQNVS
jgi:hypothetical protein